MSFGLTRRQNQVLTLLRSRQEHGLLMPTISELCQAMDLRSKGGIVRILRGLEERGFIRRLPNRARAIEIVDPETLIDAATGLALAVYCQRTGLTRGTVVARALRVYFGTHPTPKAGGAR